MCSRCGADGAVIRSWHATKEEPQDGDYRRFTIALASINGAETGTPIVEGSAMHKYMEDVLFPFWRACALDPTATTFEALTPPNLPPSMRAFVQVIDDWREVLAEGL